MINIKMLPRFKQLLSAMIIFIAFSASSQTMKSEIKTSNNSYGVSTDLWITYLNKTNLLLEKVDQQSFVNYVIFTQGGNMSDRKYFVKYVKATIKKDKEELTYRVGKGIMTKVSEINAYFSSLHTKYIVYFAEFNKNRDEIIETQKSLKAPINGNLPAFNCGSPCTNPGFESGTTFWDYYSGTADGSGTMTGIVNAFSSSAHVLETVGGFDPTIGGTT